MINKKMLIITIMLSLIQTGCKDNTNDTVQMSQDVSPSIENTITDEKEDAQKNNISINLGEKFTSDKYEMTINNYELLDRIDPSNPESFYTYYEIENEDEQLIKINSIIKNVSGESVSLQDPAFKVVINGKYKYNLNSTYESNGTFEINPYVKPLEEVNAMIFGTIPKEALNQIDTISLFFGFNDDYDNMFDSLESKDNIIEFNLN